MRALKITNLLNYLSLSYAIWDIPFYSWQLPLIIFTLSSYQLGSHHIKREEREENLRGWVAHDCCGWISWIKIEWQVGGALYTLSCNLIRHTRVKHKKQITTQISTHNKVIEISYEEGKKSKSRWQEHFLLFHRNYAHVFNSLYVMWNNKKIE